MTSLWNENYELMKELKDYTTTYVTYVQHGGHSGDFPDSLINKIIAISIKIKSNRDYFSAYMNVDIPTENEEIKIANDIMNGNYKENRLDSVIRRIYTEL